MKVQESVYEVVFEDRRYALVLCMKRTLDQEKQKKNIGVLEENNMIAKEDDQKFAIAFTNFSLDPACDVEIELKHAKDIAEMNGMTGEITDIN